MCKHIYSHVLVFRAWVETIGTRQVYDFGLLGIGKLAVSYFFFDSNTRVVAYLLVQARQCIEERSFTGIRVAHKGDF